MEVVTIFYSSTEEEPITKYRGFFQTQCEQIGRLLEHQI